MNIKPTLVLFLALVTSITMQVRAEEINIFVFSKTAAFRHESIPTGIQFLKDLGAQNNWKTTFSEDAVNFTTENLSKYDLLLFLNTTGDILNDQQQNALKAYISSGKGFVGIHAASDTEKEWTWYSDMVGAVFKSHPKIQPATIYTNPKCQHPATAHFKTKESFTDEWYNFTKPVGKQVTVLASLDETSYEGDRMNTDNHPISWYQLYEGGRIFYTGLGHTEEIYADDRYKIHVKEAIEWAAGEDFEKTSKEWTSILSEDLHENWDVYIGTPHASVTDLPNVDPKSDGMHGKPLGLNNDPKNVYSLEMMDGEPVVHITGEIYGALTSKKEYENYHLQMKFKWGEKIWEPRLTKPRDSGILYHCVGAYDGFWNVWMESQEFQVQQGDIGDYYGIADVAIEVPGAKKEGEKNFSYKKGAELRTFSRIEKGYPGRCQKGFDNEKPHGEWNTLDLVCFGDTSLHIVNGKVVMALYNSRHVSPEGKVQPLTKGRIQIQSEAAESYYKDFKIRAIDAIPEEFKNQL